MVGRAVPDNEAAVILLFVVIQEQAFVPGLPAPTRLGDGAYILVLTGATAAAGPGIQMAYWMQQGGPPGRGVRPGWINPAGWKRNSDGSIFARCKVFVTASVWKCSPAGAFYQKQLEHSGFFPQPVAFSDKDLQLERVAVPNEIDTSNSDSSVAQIKQSFCLDRVTPRRLGDGRLLLSSPEDETSKKKQNKEIKREKTLYCFFYSFAPDG